MYNGMSHMLSSVNEDSTLGVIHSVLNGTAAETWADMVKEKRKESKAAMTVCMFSFVYAKLPNGQKGGTGSHCYMFSTF